MCSSGEFNSSHGRDLKRQQQNMDKISAINRLLRFSQLIGHLTYKGRVPNTKFKPSRFLQKYSLVNLVVTFCISCILFCDGLNYASEFMSYLWFTKIIVGCFFIKVGSFATFRGIIPILEKFSHLQNYVQPRNFLDCHHFISDVLLLVYPSTILYFGVRNIIDSISGDIIVIITSVSSQVAIISLWSVPYVHSALGCCLLELLDRNLHQIVENIRQMSEEHHEYLQPAEECSFPLLGRKNKIHKSTLWKTTDDTKWVDKTLNREVDVLGNENYHRQSASAQMVRKYLREVEQLIRFIDEIVTEFMDYNSTMYTIEAAWTMSLLVMSMFIMTSEYVQGKPISHLEPITAVGTLQVLSLICNSTYYYNKGRAQCAVEFERVMADNINLYDQPAAVRILKRLEKPLDFSLHGFGRLDRALFLGAIHGVSTYLVIALQFLMPSTQQSSCT